MKERDQEKQRGKKLPQKEHVIQETKENSKEKKKLVITLRDI